MGIKGLALQWFRSYLKGRTSVLAVVTPVSSSAPISCGVPQGSVLGPLLFSLYLLPPWFNNQEAWLSSIVMQMIARFMSHLER